MSKTARNGIYTTGKKSFRVSISEDNSVQIYGIDAVDELNLEAGNNAIINRSDFEMFLDNELDYYFWHKE